MSAVPLDERIDDLETRMEKVEGGHQRLSDAMAGMKASLDRNNELTADIHDILQNLRGFANVLKVIGRTLWFVGKYVVAPLLFLSALGYAAAHHGRMPEWWFEFIRLFVAG